LQTPVETPVFLPRYPEPRKVLTVGWRPNMTSITERRLLLLIFN
jgi:hypothetical protein